MKIFGKTDIGKIRETNQDCYAAGDGGAEMAWAVVCDGMGGPAGGNIASDAAAKAMSEAISSKYKPNMSHRSIKNMMLSAVNGANVKVFDMSRANSELNGMGTTVVAAVVSGGAAHIVHVGDSRAYIVSGDSIEQLTSDHSLVQQMVDLGKITAEEARTHPQKNIITKAIGIDEAVEADYTERRFERGDIILLCTDGLTNSLTDEEIHSIIAENPGGKFVDVLVERANLNGGGDNITVVGITD